MRVYLFILLFLAIGLNQDNRLIDRWHTYEEIQAQLEEWDQQFGDNPNPSPGYPGSGIIYHLEEIGRSNDSDLPFWGVRLSYNADVKEDEPRTLFLGQCHAEEIYGVEISMQLIYMFLNPQQYIGTYYSHMKTLLQTSEIWIIPTYNPEGLQVVHGFELDGNWLQDEAYRKNRTDINFNGLFDFSVGVGNDTDGVDLNRNYDFNWFLGEGLWQVDGGCGSYYANYDYYRGPAPFSESEVGAIRDFATDQNFLLSIAYHSSRSGCVSEKIVYPWEWDVGKQSPDFQVISQLGEDIAHLIPDEEGSGYYLAIPSVSRRGNAHDWLYTQTGCIQYLIETGSANLQPTDESLITDTINRNLRGAFHLMNRAIGNAGQGDEDPLGADDYQIKGIVTDSETGYPVTAIITFPQMDGPMLEPRTTDEFGRFRRLLYPGTFQINVDARGYESQSHSVTSSSSVTNVLDVSLVPKPQYEFSIEILTPELYGGVIFITYQDEIGIVDTISTFENNVTILLPQNSYEISIWGSDDIYPKHITLNLESDISTQVELKWAGVLFIETFEDMSGWTVADGFWNIQMGSLLSQNSLIYPDAHQSLIESDPFSLNDNSVLEMVLDFQYEFEWGNDTGFVNLSTENFNFRVNRTLQNWENHREFIPIENISGDMCQISVGMSSDSNIGYRGLHIDTMSLWYEPLSDCPIADLNRDGLSDILDIVSMVDGILNISFTNYQLCTSDVTGEGDVDILDIVYIIMVILQP